MTCVQCHNYSIVTYEGVSWFQAPLKLFPPAQPLSQHNIYVVIDIGFRYEGGAPHVRSLAKTTPQQHLTRQKQPHIGKYF